MTIFSYEKAFPTLLNGGAITGVDFCKQLSSVADAAVLESELEPPSVNETTLLLNDDADEFNVTATDVDQSLSYMGLFNLPQHDY